MVFISLHEKFQLPSSTIVNVVAYSVIIRLGWMLRFIMKLGAMLGKGPCSPVGRAIMSRGEYREFLLYDLHIFQVFQVNFCVLISKICLHAIFLQICA